MLKNIIILLYLQCFKLLNIKILYYIFIFCMAIHLSKAQNLGARSSGLAYTSITISDVWAASNNIAASAQLDKSSVGLHYDNRFFQSSFNTIGFAVVQPTYKLGNASMVLQRFGNQHFSRTNIALGYAHKIEWVSLGIQLEYVQSYVSEFGSKNNLMINFGGMARITNSLQFGATIKNINQASLAKYTDERLPTVMALGISYRPYEKLMLNAQVQKDVERQASFHFGTEYEIIQNFKVRTGISAPIFFAHFGIGYAYHGFELNYSAMIHEKLGFSNAISLNYSFGNKSTTNTSSKTSLIP